MTFLRRATVAVALAAAAACTRSPAPPLESVAPSAPDASVAAEQGTDGGLTLTLTLADVDRYLAYRRAVTALHKRIAPQLDALEQRSRKAKDAGQVAQQGLLLWGEEARAQEQARQQSGLTEAQLDRLEQAVEALVTLREMADDTAHPDQIAEMEALARKLPTDQRGALELSIEELRRRRLRAEQLPELRAEYGSANVEVLLQRERELRQAWNDWLSALAGAPSR